MYNLAFYVTEKIRCNIQARHKSLLASYHGHREIYLQTLSLCWLWPTSSYPAQPSLCPNPHNQAPWTSGFPWVRPMGSTNRKSESGEKGWGISSLFSPFIGSASLSVTLLFQNYSSLWQPFQNSAAIPPAAEISLHSFPSAPKGGMTSGS